MGLMMDISKYRSQKTVVVDKGEDGQEDFTATYDSNSISLDDYEHFMRDLDQAEAGGKNTEAILTFLNRVGMTWNLTEGTGSKKKPIPTDRETLRKLKPARVVVMTARAIIDDLQGGNPLDTKSSGAG